MKYIITYMMNEVGKDKRIDLPPRTKTLTLLVELAWYIQYIWESKGQYVASRVYTLLKGVGLY
jgi:hypothetical protein